MTSYEILARAQVAAARLTTSLTVRLGNASCTDLEAAKRVLRTAALEARELADRLDVAALELGAPKTRADDAVAKV